MRVVNECDGEAFEPVGNDTAGWVPLALSTGLLAVAAVLRYIWLDGADPTGDEAFSWRLSQYPFQDIVRRTAGDVHPPLYYLLLKGWTSLCGSNMSALRGLSALLSVLCVPLIYAVCLEARKLHKGRAQVHAGAYCTGAILSALLLSCSVCQLAPARSARMYALGVLLAGVTAWLLLRALRDGGAVLRWWLAYGVIAAAFCYTHYSAFFTLLGQALFVVIYLVFSARYGPRHVTAVRVVGFLLAAGTALLLYGPWLPVWWTQYHAVRQSYWIPRLREDLVAHAFLTWSTGWARWHPLLFAVFGIVIGTLATCVVLRLHWAGIFFLCQWSVPWAACLAISWFGHQSIFVQRYLVFANFSLIAFWGAVWWFLPSAKLRYAFGCTIVLCCMAGLSADIRSWPRLPSNLRDAALFLAQNARSDDLILVRYPIDVNRLRYYARQFHASRLTIRCNIEPLMKVGRATHLASMSADEVCWTDDASACEHYARVWYFIEAQQPTGMQVPGFRLVSERRFQRATGLECAVFLHARIPSQGD